MDSFVDRLLKCIFGWKKNIYDLVLSEWWCEWFHDGAAEHIKTEVHSVLVRAHFLVPDGQACIPAEARAPPFSLSYKRQQCKMPKSRAVLVMHQMIDSTSINTEEIKDMKKHSAYRFCRFFFSCVFCRVALKTPVNASHKAHKIFWSFFRFMFMTSMSINTRPSASSLWWPKLPS